MKLFVLVAGLMLIGTQAWAAPPHRPAGDFAYRHNNYQTHGSDTLQVADRDRGDRHRDRDQAHRDRDQRHRDADNRSRNWDRHRDADRRDRDFDHYRHYRRDRDYDWYGFRSPAFLIPPFGVVQHRLPDRHVIVHVRRHRYYYYGGTFWDRDDGSFVIVNAPIGAVVPYLPNGYISFLIGPSRYFYFGGTYYIQQGQQYVVVKPPSEAHTIVQSAQHEMIIYPAKGQSQKQLDKDRYECHRWAVGQTGFDPSANNPNLSLKPDYNRAMSACLDARGYVVK